MKKPNRLGAFFLCGAAAGFLLLTFQPWWNPAFLPLFGKLTLGGLLKAFFEASLVGALADWFAVTALFKHPGGIPLPHTNILAQRKDQLAEALPQFFAGFFQPENLRPLIQSTDFASRIYEGIKNGVLKDIFGSMAEDKASSKGVVEFLLGQFDVPGSVSTLLQWTRKSGFDDKLIEGGTEILRGELLKNRPLLIEPLTRLVKKNAGWKGFFVNSDTVEKMIDGVLEELAYVRSDPRHEFRGFLRTSLSTFAQRLSLPRSPERENFQNFLSQALAEDDLKKAFFALLGGAEEEFLKNLAENEAYRASFNLFVGNLLLGVLEKSPLIPVLAKSLTSLLKKTETQAFVRRIEDAVWNDLQYIRVNGALVGGLAGMALAVLAGF